MADMEQVALEYNRAAVVTTHWERRALPATWEATEAVLRRRVAELEEWCRRKDLQLLAQAERIKEQSELLSKAAENRSAPAAS